MQGVPFTPEEIDSIKKGIVKDIHVRGLTFTEACLVNKVDHSTAYKWKKVDEEWKAVVREALLSRDDMVTDLAESALAKNIKEGRERSIEFYLKCKARHRGYTPVQGIEGNIAQTVDFKIEFRDSGVTDDDGTAGS